MNFENNKEKIAILADSCCDVPKEYVDKYDMFSVPLKVIYSNGEEYLDKINITSKEVIERFQEEIPKTSLPDAETVKLKYDEIKEAGYEKLIVITISSGLSGTNNLMRLVASEYEGLEIKVIDTKNIGIGAGFFAIKAGMLRDEGKSFEEIAIDLELSVPTTQIFFCVKTLEYLKKGGRIGLVSGTIGELLDLKPIISCNEDGIYHTVAKVRGRNKSLLKTLECAVNFGKDFNRYSIAIVEAGAEEEAKELRVKLENMLPNAEIKLYGNLTPALVVHTGPGLIGIGVQKLG